MLLARALCDRAMSRRFDEGLPPTAGKVNGARIPEGMETGLFRGGNGGCCGVEDAETVARCPASLDVACAAAVFTEAERCCWY